MNRTETPAPNFYSSGGHDRDGHLRHDAAAMERRRADPAARVVPVVGTMNLFAANGAAACLAPGELPAGVLDHERLVWLGEFRGAPHFALLLDEDDGRLARQGRLRDLRRESARLSADEASLLATARSLAHWHAHNRFCGRCGAPTLAIEAGHARACSAPGCAHKQFPRLDPAVIVRVTCGEQLLLARQPHWPVRRYSVLAGFVEAGESAEDTVAREVREEAGLELDAVRYHSSQPWPYPHALMLGFTARAVAPQLHVDHAELAEAMWIDRAALGAALAAGSIKMPPPFSIAHRLIREWFDAEVPESGLWDTE